MKGKRWTYGEAGVDVSRIRQSQRDIAALLRGTFKNRVGKTGSVLGEIGHYAGLIDIGGGSALALHVDGVGTKVLVAQMMNRFDTIGVDCVAMNVNDVICVGAEPVAFVDYIALEKMDEDLVRELMKGLISGADEASVAVVGGETAVMPNVIEGVGDKAFDLAGMVAGVVSKQRVITGNRVREGDVIVGVESSGLHSNGYSLARKVLLSKYGVDECVEGLEESLGEELLKPTRIYVKPVMEVLRKSDVSGLAHITGGSFAKMRRLVGERNLGFRIDGLPDPPAIFELIRREGGVSKREMYRTFNMGIGFCLTAPEDEVEGLRRVFKRYRMETYVVGWVVKGSGVYVGKLKIDD